MSPLLSSQFSFFPHRNSSENGDDELKCSAFLKVIFENFHHPSVLTRLTALRWIEVLLSVIPEALFSNAAELMPLMLELLSDPAVEVKIIIWTFIFVSRLCTPQCRW